MTGEDDNPGYRLHRVLSQLLPGKRNLEARKALAAVLEVPEGDFPTLLERVAHLYRLPDQVAEMIRRIHGEKAELYLPWYVRLKELFQANKIDATVAAYLAGINESDVGMILVCAHQIAGDGHSPVLAVRERRSLLNEVRALLELVAADAEIDEGVREYLTINLLRIEAALLDYSLQGIAPVVAAASASAGSMILQPHVAVASKSAESGRAFWAFVGRLHLLVRTATGLLALPEAASEAIEHVRELLPPNGDELAALPLPVEQDAVADVATGGPAAR